MASDPCSSRAHDHVGLGGESRPSPDASSSLDGFVLDVRVPTPLEDRAMVGATRMVVVLALAALALSLSHFVVQYLKLIESYARLLAS